MKEIVLNTSRDIGFLSGRSMSHCIAKSSMSSVKNPILFTAKCKKWFPQTSLNKLD